MTIRLFHCLCWPAALLLGAAGCEDIDVVGPSATAVEAEAIRARLATASGAEAGGGGNGQQVTGWADLSGRFIFDGGVPTPGVKPGFNPKAEEVAICSPGGQSPLDQSLVVGADGGISNIAIFLRRAPSVHESALAAPSESPIFDQKQCVFLTHVFACRVGQQVTLMNSDPLGHNTNISGKAANQFNQTIVSGNPVQYTPGAEEALPVSVACNIHPWMKAYLLPRENNYFAVTNPDGSFQISQLPAGVELEFQVWHERGTGTAGGLALDTPETKPLKWSSRGRFKVTLTADEPMDLGEIKIPPAAVGG